jgi:hypothetical protein
MTNIGVIGYSVLIFNKIEAKTILETVLTVLNKEYPEITIVSGLTYYGVPAIAYDIAREREYRTIGVACSRALTMTCFPVNEQYIFGTEWGDESEKFLSMCDVLIRVGGGKQSLNEAETFKKLYPTKRIYEFSV